MKVKLKRAKMKRGMVGIDVTRQNAKDYALEFAPSWDMVMGVKKGNKTKEEYIQEYKNILDKISLDAWKWLYRQGKETGEITLLCFCKSEDFCHTYLIIDYACEKYPSKFEK